MKMLASGLMALLLAGGATVKPGPELTLARLQPGRDKLARAIQLYGKHYTEAYPNTPDLLLWADPRNHIYLKLELTEDKLINAITVSSYGPDSAPSTSLALTAGACGRGLRLGDPIEKVTQLYGKPYFQGPSTDAGRDLILVVHKFNVPEDQPQVMETSFDPQTKKLVKITLSFPYY